MRKIVISPKFERSLRRYIRRHPDLKKRLELVIQQIESDVFAPSLETHSLKGKLDGLQGCSCGYDCRIVLRIEPETVILLDIGTHDDVY